MLMTLRAGDRSIERWGMTRTPRGSLGPDLTLGRAVNRVLRAHPEGAVTGSLPGGQGENINL